MTSRLRLIAAACLALLAIAVPQASYADEFSTNQRGEVERIVREYLIAHPEVIQDAMAELEKRQSAADAEKHKAAVKQYSEALFASPRQVVLGNPDGNVTFVEFFDYNCGYCKRAMDDMPPGRLMSVNRTSMAAPESMYSSASSAVVTSWTKKPDALRASATRLLMRTSSSTTRTETGVAPRIMFLSPHPLQKFAAFMVSKGLTTAPVESPLLTPPLLP